jgi:sugar phosphate isomerase/epimerase
MLGVSTFCLHREPLESALDQISEITSLIEVMDDGLHYVTDTSLLESYNVNYSFHAPSRGVNIASLLEPIRRASVEVTGHCLGIAAEVNADVIVHPGYFAWTEEREVAVRQLKTSLRDLSLLSEEYTVNFFVENMGNWNYFFLRSPDELDLIGEIGLALDVGHAHLNGCLDEFLTCPIRHIHLHDNDGTDDTHAPVGNGTIDFKAVMKAVRFSGATQIVEVDTLEGVQRSIDVLEKM